MRRHPRRARARTDEAERGKSLPQAGRKLCESPCADIEHYDPNTRGASKDGTEVPSDGPTHFDVPLIGPIQQPGTPCWITHFTLPSPRAREILIAEPARTAVAGLN